VPPTVPMTPEDMRKLPEGLTTIFYCTACERDMRIPLLNNIPSQRNVLICGTPFDSPDLRRVRPVPKR